MSASVETIKQGLERSLPADQAELAVAQIVGKVDAMQISVPDPVSSPIREVQPGQTVNFPDKGQVVNTPDRGQKVNLASREEAR
jgi:hypothetical protein